MFSFFRQSVAAKAEIRYGELVIARYVKTHSILSEVTAIACHSSEIAPVRLGRLDACRNHSRLTDMSTCIQPSELALNGTRLISVALPALISRTVACLPSTENMT